MFGSDTLGLKDCSYITDDNFKYYLCAIVIAPCIFYVPKFFELYAEEIRVGVDITVNCHSILNPPKVNLTVMKGMLSCPWAIQPVYSGLSNKRTGSIKRTGWQIP